MFRWLDRILKSSEWRLSLWTLLFGKEGLMAGGTAVALWATYATEAVRQYAPLSYVVVALGTCLTIYLIYALYAFAASRLQIVRFRQVLHDASKINPLDTYFEKQRIRVTDLAPAVGGAIVGKTFVECEIVGPTNVMFTPTCTFHGSGGDGVDGLVLRPDKFPKNGFGFDGCSFRNCRFYLLTFMVPEPLFAAFATYQWTGINWLTELPASGGAPPLIPPSAGPTDTRLPPSTQ